MKQTAVEWLKKEIFKRYKFTFQIYNCQPLEEAIQQAKELEEKQRDEFAIGFAEWLELEETQQLIIDLQMVGELPKEPTTQQLLEIYKKENGL